MCLEWLIFAFAAPGGVGTGSATIGTTSISNNSATPGNGGGILVESLATTVATTSLTSNSAGNRGGGIFVRGASLLLNGTSPSITFTGNTATNGGSSVSTSSAVRVNGTNTTIGGDIEISVLVEQHHRPLTKRSLVPRHSTDSAGNSTTKTVEVHVGHNITSPKSGNRFKINTAVTFTGTFWDVPGKRHTAVWQFDDLTTGATVTEPVGSSNGTVSR